MARSLAEVLGEGGLVARALPGFEPRATQLAMAEAVAAALADERPLCVEAGTGTGKTLAYLVPAVLSGRRVVISTASRTLQEQLYSKDLPLLGRALGEPIEAACLKGIANYLCRRRLGEALHAMIGTEDPALREIARWADETPTGDRAELRALPDESPAWAGVLSSTETRIGPRCPDYDRCFVTGARRAAGRARIVVVNHHLFFADLALRKRWPGAQVLPPYDAVVFDEAHRIEEIATQFFGTGVSSHRVSLLVREARRLLVDVLRDGAGVRLCDHAAAKASDLFRALASLIDSATSRGEGRIEAPAALFDGPRRASWLRLDSALEELHQHALGRANETLDDPLDLTAVAQREAVSQLASRTADVRDDLALLADRTAVRGHVYWAEARGAEAVQIQASPIDVGPLLRERLHETNDSVIFTSATLAPGGDFAYFRRRIGLVRTDTAETVLASPFDYARNALLYVATDLPDPGDPRFAEGCADRLRTLCTASAGRAFALFTSHRNLQAVAARLRLECTWPLHVQGEAPRSALLEAFRARPGVLLGSSSFWEGVDVPGEALSLVMIDRLPFSPPDDPVQRARCDRLAEEGEDPFRAHQLPHAVLALRQGFGRLIRSTTDRGVVAVLDRRLMTRGYGRAFLTALPPAPRTTRIEDVQRFFRRDG